MLRKRIKNKRLKRLFDSFNFCLPIATLIIVTAVLSDVAVKFFVQTNIIMGILTGLVGTILITFVLMFLISGSPKMKKMLSTMFGLTEELDSKEKGQGEEKR